jgi:hypothetical protein
MSEQNFVNPELIIFPENLITEDVPVYEPEPATPVGESPFPSWQWVSNNLGVGFWSAPVPQPRVHNKPFLWNEPDLSWYYKDEESNSWIKYTEES